MVVRIRFRTGPRLQHARNRTRHLALALGSLLTPAALLAALLAFWRIAADLNWAGSFAISSGLFSHWQTWLAGAALLQVCAHILNGCGKSGEKPASKPEI